MSIKITKKKLFNNKDLFIKSQFLGVFTHLANIYIKKVMFINLINKQIVIPQNKKIAKVFLVSNKSFKLININSFQTAKDFRTIIKKESLETKLLNNITIYSDKKIFKKLKQIIEKYSFIQSDKGVINLPKKKYINKTKRKIITA